VRSQAEPGYVFSVQAEIRGGFGGPNTDGTAITRTRPPKRGAPENDPLREFVREATSTVVQLGGGQVKRAAHRREPPTPPEARGACRLNRNEPGTGGIVRTIQVTGAGKPGHNTTRN